MAPGRLVTGPAPMLEPFRAGDPVLYKCCGAEATDEKSLEPMLLAGLVLLVVEDDLDNLELLSSYLEGEGATVIGAGSLAVALKLSADCELSALLSDLELPDGTGCDLLQQLRERGGRHVPAIALTGYSDAKWRARAADCGFDRYAVKPFALEQLSEWVLELSDRKSDVPGATCPDVPDRAEHGPPRR